MRIPLPYGVVCISVIYAAFCLAFLDQGFECEGDCNTHGVENFPIAWGSDFFLGVVLVVLASHLMCYRRGLRKGVLALISQAAAYILWGIVRLYFPNDGSVDGKGLRGYFIVNMLAYLLATDSFIEIAGIVVQIYSHVNSNYRPCFFNRRILKFFVAVTVMANLCIAAGSLWCIGSNVTGTTNGADIEIPACVSWIQTGQNAFTACSALAWIAASYGFGAFTKMMAERHGVWYWIWGLPMPLAAAGVVIIQLLVFIFHVMILALTSQSGKQAQGTMASFASIAYHNAALMTGFFTHNLIATLAVPMVNRHHENNGNPEHENKSTSSVIFWARDSVYSGSDSGWPNGLSNESNTSAVSMLGEADPSKDHSESTYNMDQSSVTSNSTGEISESAYTTSTSQTVRVASPDVEEGTSSYRPPGTCQQPIAIGQNDHEGTNQSVDAAEASVYGAVVDTLGLQWASQLVFSFLETVETQTQQMFVAPPDAKTSVEATENGASSEMDAESVVSIGTKGCYPVCNNDIENPPEFQRTTMQDGDNPDCGVVHGTLESMEANVAGLTSRLRDEKIFDFKPTSLVSTGHGSNGLSYVGEEIIMTFDVEEDVQAQEVTEPMEAALASKANDFVNNMVNEMDEECSKADHDASEKLNRESSHSSLARIDMLGLVEHVGAEGLTNSAFDSQVEVEHESKSQANECRCENDSDGQEALEMEGGISKAEKLQFHVQDADMNNDTLSSNVLCTDSIAESLGDDTACDMDDLPQNVQHTEECSREDVTEEGLARPLPIVDEEPGCLEGQSSGTMTVVPPPVVGPGMWDFLTLITQRVERRPSNENSTSWWDAALTNATPQREQSSVPDADDDHNSLDCIASQTTGTLTITPATYTETWDFLTLTPQQRMNSDTSNDNATGLDAFPEDHDEPTIYQ